jgi:hypothetical protein
MRYLSHFGWLLPKFYGILVVVIGIIAAAQGLVSFLFLRPFRHTLMEVTP